MATVQQQPSILGRGAHHTICTVSKWVPVSVRPACVASWRPGPGPVSKPQQLTTCAAFVSSSNPALNNYSNIQESVYTKGGRRNDIMTVDGAAQKTSILLLIAVASAMYSWSQLFSGNAAAAMATMQTAKAAGIAGFVAAIGTMFKPHWSPTLAPIYAVCKGVALGAMSGIYEIRYPGIVLNAAMLTFGVAASLLAGFQMRIINVSDNFRATVSMVTGGYMFTLLGMWIMSMIGVQLPSIMSGGPIGMGLCLVSAGIAASNILLDFDQIRATARQGMPKWFEWYSSFSLMVSLVWCYMSIIRLLAMLYGGRSDD